MSSISISHSILWWSPVLPTPPNLIACVGVKSNFRTIYRIDIELSSLKECVFDESLLIFNVFLTAILQIDMFGPILMAVRSYPAGKYICYNPTTGYVEIKVR